METMQQLLHGGDYVAATKGPVPQTHTKKCTHVLTVVHRRTHAHRHIPIDIVVHVRNCMHVYTITHNKQTNRHTIDTHSHAQHRLTYTHIAHTQSYAEM